MALLSTSLCCKKGCQASSVIWITFDLHTCTAQTTEAGDEANRIIIGWASACRLRHLNKTLPGVASC